MQRQCSLYSKVYDMSKQGVWKCSTQSGSSLSEAFAPFQHVQPVRQAAASTWQ
jgi:hypothetical protein